MAIRHHAKTFVGLIVAIAVFAPPVVWAQSLFDTPAAAPAAAPTPTPAAPATRAAPKRKAVARKKPRKPRAPIGVSMVHVFNRRAATLVELSLTSTTVKDAKPQIVAHDLAGGKASTTALAKNGGCIYDVSGDFADQSTIEISALDLCKDNNLNLVE